MDIDWLTEVDFKASSVSHQSVNPRFRYDNNTLSKVHDLHCKKDFDHLSSHKILSAARRSRAEPRQQEVTMT